MKIAHPCVLEPTAEVRRLEREVLAQLEAIDPFPARKGLRRNIMQAGQDRVQGFTLGKTIAVWGHPPRMQHVPCVRNKVYPGLLRSCRALMRAIDPRFRWNCVQVNKDQKTALHWDTHNQGPSYIVGLGDYAGGDLTLHYSDRDVDADIRGRALRFDGRVPHSTRPFRRHRYTLVFFQISIKPSPAAVMESPLAGPVPSCGSVPPPGYALVSPSRHELARVRKGLASKKLGLASKLRRRPSGTTASPAPPPGAPRKAEATVTATKTPPRKKRSPARPRKEPLSG